LNKYELAVLYHPDLEVDLDKGEQRVKKIIDDNKGKIVETDNWGKKKLAYPINKLESAVYVFYTVELPGPALQKVESILNITDEVLRYLIVKIDPKEQAKVAAAKEAAEKKRAKAPKQESETEE
jgi:small subunit ribosomal protein S6